MPGVFSLGFGYVGVDFFRSDAYQNGIRFTETLHAELNSFSPLLRDWFSYAKLSNFFKREVQKFDSCSKIPFFSPAPPSTTQMIFVNKIFGTRSLNSFGISWFWRRFVIGVWQVRECSHYRIVRECSHYCSSLVLSIMVPNGLHTWIVLHTTLLKFQVQDLHFARCPGSWFLKG